MASSRQPPERDSDTFGAVERPQAPGASTAHPPPADLPPDLPQSEPSETFSIPADISRSLLLAGAQPIRELSSSGQTGTQPPLAVLEAEERLRQRLGHAFRRPELLVFALTHPSWRHEHPKVPVDNQRLEFLGDLVVGLAIGELLLHVLRDGAEGELSLLRHEVVRERTLAAAAEQLDLGAALRLGRGAELRGARQQASILADGLEAVIGAVFLDAGYDTARAVTMRVLGAHVDDIVARYRNRGPTPAGAHLLTENYKSALQEHLARHGAPPPSYTLLAQVGPAQAPRFRVQASATFGGQTWLAIGEGLSKKAAENAAAERLFGDVSKGSKGVRY